MTMTRQDLGAIAAELGADADPGLIAVWVPRYNIAPGQVLPLLREDGGGRRLEAAAWGYRSERRPLVNIRGEGLLAGSFREAFRSRRCVVPVDGFFEWTGPARAREPVWYHAPKNGLLLLAGLWQRDPLAFAVLTTAANQLVAAVHNRMPVVLDPAQAAEWLSRPASEKLRPAPEGALIATPVSRRVNDAHHDDPACLEPVGQLRLI